MNCPSCGAALDRVTYEGLPLFRCGCCYGYLVARKRVEGIKRSREKRVEDLKEEAVTEGQGNTAEEIRCPRCRGKMKKESSKQPASVQIDTCQSCELIWFDGGELAVFAALLRGGRHWR